MSHKEKNIFYLTSMQLPNRWANSYQVLKTAEALSNIGMFVTIFAIAREENSVRSYYKISGRIKFSLTRYRENHIFLNLRYLWRILSKRNAGAVIYTRDTIFVYAAFIFRIFGFPVIFEVHRLSSRSLYDKLRRWALFRIASGYVVISDTLKGALDRFGKPSVRAYCGTDPELFRSILQKNEAREKIGKYKQRKMIVYAGSLHERQGINFLISTFCRIDSNKVSLVIIGGSGDEILHVKKEAINICENIDFVGYLDKAQLVLYLSAADVLVIPSALDDAGGSPVKMFEYLYFGRVIVAPKTPVIEEVLHNGSNAILFSYNDGESFKNALDLALSDEAKSYGENAIKDADRYTFDKRAREISNLIKSF